MILLWDFKHFQCGPVFGDGTSPEGRPIMTQGSNNCDCSSAIGEQRCINVIWDAEYDGLTHVSIFRFRVRVWRWNVSWRAPNYDQGSNCDCNSAIDGQRCIERLFEMPSTMDVPTCPFFVFVAGFGDGTSPEGRPIMTKRSNCDCCSAIDEQTCIQWLFGMRSTIDVPTCPFWGSVFPHTVCY